MNQRTASVAFVAALVIVAGGPPLAGAMTQTNDAASATTAVAAQETNGTENLNVTVDTLTLRNVTLNRVDVDHIHVIEGVTDESGATVVGSENGSRTVENVTADSVFVGDATLENVSFTELTIRNESVAEALLGPDAANVSDGETITSATLENATVDGFVVTHGTVRSAQVENVTVESADAVENETTADAEPAVTAHSLSAENGTLGNVTATNLSVEESDASHGNETTDGGTEETTEA